MMNKKILYDNSNIHYFRTRYGICHDSRRNSFNIKTNTNTAALFNKLVIPNEDSSTTGSSGGSTHKVHKGKKLNYVSQINPQTLRQLTGSVSDMSGTTTMENSHSDDNYYLKDYY